MAGAGYKLFNTGDVLTAAQVNTYLMEQTVMVFADAAARTTALTGVVSEGMISYLKDTNAVEVYNGSAWVASDDPNAIQNTIVDAKGDLITATAADTPARLAVGSNGDTLVADSAASTGLRWQGNYAAGKNAIINGDFRIWQRGAGAFSTFGVFTADRFSLGGDGGTNSVTRQSFTPGTAPVAGYEAEYFLRMTTTVSGSLNLYIIQPVEDVRTFAGQTVTLSYWAKCGSGTVTSTPLFAQNFGSGGSSSVVTNASNSASITTSWQRFTHTVTLPSISGKTIGSSSYLQVQVLRFAASATVDLWGVQLEAGSVATAFQTATGTLQGELAACQRYYYRNTTGSNYGVVGSGSAGSTTAAVITIPLPVPMRVKPASVDAANLELGDNVNAGSAVTSVAINTNINNSYIAAVDASVASGLTQYRYYNLRAANNTAAYLGLSAEL
jgi:hypothetical protein